MIDNGATVTVNVGTAECKNIVINGTLSFNAGMLLEVYGDLTNHGTFNAGTGNISFTGAGSSAINGSTATAFNNVIINKGQIPLLLWKPTGPGHFKYGHTHHYERFV